jgi:hypothetical protein
LELHHEKEVLALCLKATDALILQVASGLRHAGINKSNGIGGCASSRCGMRAYQGISSSK